MGLVNGVWMAAAGSTSKQSLELLLEGIRVLDIFVLCCLYSNSMPAHYFWWHGGVLVSQSSPGMPTAPEDARMPVHHPVIRG